MKKQNVNNEKYKICSANSNVGARLCCAQLSVIGKTSTANECPCPSRRNTQRGITLIALIITIIILLILAVVSIRLVINNGILGKAETAVKQYSESETEEKIQLAYTDYQMGKLTDDSYTFEQALQNGKVAYTSVTGNDTEGYIVTATLSDGTEKKYKVSGSGISTLKTAVEEYGVKIGDYVAYTPSTETYTSPQGTYTSATYAIVPTTIEQGSGYSSDQIFSTSSYTGGWRVLGIDDKTGELQLISADNITTSTGSDYYLRGYTGATYGEKELNNICEIYGKGENATGARSVNVDDVNKITGYNPERTGDGKPYGSGSILEYGNEVTYAWGSRSDYVKSSGTNGKSNGGISTNSSVCGFNYHDENWNWRRVSYTSGSEICRLKSTNYYYYPYSLTTSSSTSGTQAGISTTSPEYYTLFCNSSNTKIPYWLASPYVNAGAYNVGFGLHYVGGDRVYFNSLYVSNGLTNSNSCGVRPVVSLSSNIQLDTTSTDGSSATSAYVIK